MSNALRDLIKQEIEQALLLVHTNFIGKVVAVHGERADVQPLTYAKDVQGDVYPQPLISGAPRLEGVEVAVGDVVLCAVCERDISHAIRGQLSAPAPGHHSLSDSVIIGRVYAGV